MKNNYIKKLIKDLFFREGSIRKIAFGPLKGTKYRVTPITGMETWHSAHERPLQSAFVRLVKKNEKVIDVGANWGGHALLLSKLVGPLGMVLAVEPSPSVIAETKWHIEKNCAKNIILEESALSDSEGVALFEEEGLSTTGKLSSSKSKNKTFEVKLGTLDSLINKFGFHDVALIKIDVEGAEGKVLEGAKNTLNSIRPNLIIELHNPEQDKQVSQILRSSRYSLFRLDGKKIPKPEAVWPDRDGVWGIILAIPEEKSN